MTMQTIIPAYNFSAMIAEDAGAPVLRSPNAAYPKKAGPILRALRKFLSGFGE